MTLRDAVLLADGVTPDAWLKEAEIARLDSNPAPGALATTVRVPLDSTYLARRAPGGGSGRPARPHCCAAARRGRSGAPPGRPAPAAGAPETPLQPYDNVMIMRQAGWDLQ